MKHFICVTCGMQYAAGEREPDGCPICLDERQYVGHGGQEWTTLDEYRKSQKNVFAEEEADLHSVLPRPKAGIGQRAFVVRTKEGYVRSTASRRSPTRQSRRSRSPAGWRRSRSRTRTSTRRSWDGVTRSGRCRSICTSSTPSG